MLADKLAKNNKKYFFNLTSMLYMLVRTVSIRRGAAAQIACNSLSLSADYMLQSEIFFLHLKALSNDRKLV